MRKIALLLHPDSGSEGYLLQSVFFDGLTENPRFGFTRESLAGVIPVGAHQTVFRAIRFLSNTDSPSDFRPLLVRGEYQGTVLVWTSPDDGPAATAAFNFVLSERNLKDLAEMRSGTNMEAVALQLESLQRWGARIVDEHELGELLGSR